MLSMEFGSYCSKLGLISIFLQGNKEWNRIISSCDTGAKSDKRQLSVKILASVHQKYGIVVCV